MDCYEELQKIKEKYQAGSKEFFLEINKFLDTHNCGEFTLEEIGKILGITRERVRQIESSALKKLKHPKLGRKFKKILEDI